MFSAQGTRILDFPSKIALHTANFYIMTPVLCQEDCLPLPQQICFSLQGCARGALV
jgi:hypothetical protein